MSIQKEIFSFVIEILENLKIPYMIGGSVASIAYGEPRLTLDMDVVVKMGLEQAEKLASAFDPAYYVNLPSIIDAIKNYGHFNIIQSEEGVKIDFYVLADDAFSREEFSRRQSELLNEDKKAFFASPEDIILKKLEWYKEGQSQKQLEDVKGILRVSGPKLDQKYIERWAHKLGVYQIWQVLIKESTSKKK